MSQLPKFHDAGQCIARMARGLSLAVLLLTGGSAQAGLLGDGVTYFWSASRFEEMEAAAREQLKDGDKQGATYVAPLCLALGKLKRYGQLFECVDRLDGLVQGGDTTLTHPDVPWGPMPSDVAPLPSALRAEAYLELGDYARSREEAGRALAVISDRNDMGLLNPTSYQLDMYAVLSIGAAMEGDIPSAEKHLAALEKVSIPFTGALLYRNQKRNALGRVYMSLGRYEQALAQLKQEHMKFVEAVGDMFLRKGDTLASLYDLAKALMLAKCLAETGRDEEAAKLLDGLLANPRAGDQGGILWPALYERGRIFERAGNAPEAIGQYRRAVDVVERQRASINTEASRIGFVGDKQAVYRSLITALVQAGRHAEAFNYLERSKSRALVDMLASKRDFAVREGDSARVSQLLAGAERAELDGLAETMVAPSSPSGQRSLAVSAARKMIAEVAPEVSVLVTVSAEPLEKITERIPRDEMLVEYYYDESLLFIFLISDQGLQVVQEKAEGIEAQVKAVREAVAKPGSEDFLPIAQRLYRQLVSPVEAQLGDRTKLTIVPHGSLHYLPFAALHDGERYLIERHAFRMLPSASVLGYLPSQTAAKQGDLLAFGNPDLGDPAHDLEFAQAEALAITRERPHSLALLRKDASESALHRYAGQFSRLHFATHGRFDPENPLGSAILLAKDESHDGLLTVDKLYTMRLDADLVTLSACETGLGRIASGDDVVGLTRGFLYAGASTIVASLWQVDDLATAQLMEKFYNGMGRYDKREALRQAQIDTARNRAHPYYWAAFQLTGNAR